MDLFCKCCASKVQQGNLENYAKIVWRNVMSQRKLITWSSDVVIFRTYNPGTKCL
jgi:hypothetical protein